jgi:hypothetical protein
MVEVDRNNICMYTADFTVFSFVNYLGHGELWIFFKYTLNISS